MWSSFDSVRGPVSQWTVEEGTEVSGLGPGKILAFSLTGHILEQIIPYACRFLT